MHIALLTTYFPPDTYAGIGRYVEDLAIGLVNNGHDVEVIAIGKMPYVETNRNGFKIHWLLNTNKWIPSFMPFLRLLWGSYLCRKKLIERHNKNPFDIVEYPNAGIAGLIYLLFPASSLKPKLIVRLTSPRSVVKKRSQFYRITESLEALQVRNSDAILAVSKTNYAICKISYSFATDKPHKIILLGLPYGAKLFLAEPLSKSDLYLRVFFLGRMEDRKGFDVLAKAWPKVIAAIPDAKLIVAGENLSHKGKHSFFEWAIQDLSEQVCKQIEYLGVVNDETRELLYQQCDICVIPSRYESFGLISLEAMRYGKPIVSTNVGGIPEVVKQNVTGLLVSPSDHESLANAVICLLSNKEMREQMGKMALADVQERFSSERMVAETEEFYYSLINKK